MKKSEDKLLSIKEAAELMNVTIQTLRNWEKSGKITCYRTAGNHRRYDRDELLQTMQQFERPIIKRRITIGYIRTSTFEKEERQKQEKIITSFCENNGYVFKIIKDTGSAMEYDRKGFQELIELVCSSKVDRIVVNYKDRLVRFGFEMLEKICEIYDVEIVVLNQTEDEGSNKEVIDDILSIIRKYAAKLYGSQSQEAKKINEQNKKMFKIN